MQEDIQLYPVRPDEALRELIDDARLRPSPPLDRKCAGAGAAAQQLRLPPAQGDGLIGVHRGTGYDPLLIEQTVEACLLYTSRCV